MVNIDKEIDEVLHLAGVKLNEEENKSTFRLPEGVPSKNFKLTNSLADIQQWRAKILVNNSGQPQDKVGNFDKTDYIMINLKDNTIIPIARADEHKTGYEVLYDVYQEEYGLNVSEYFSVICRNNDTNYPYNKEDADLLKEALIKCKSYGMNLSTSYVYMKYIDDAYKNADWDSAKITAEDFVNGNYGLASYGDKITPLGEKLYQAFKALSDTFMNKNIRGKISVAQVKSAIKKLYTIGNRIQLPENYKLIGNIDLEQMLDVIEEYKSDYIDEQRLYKLFFGYGGFRNNIHQRLRKYIADDKLNEQLGSVKVIVSMIGSI